MTDIQEHQHRFNVQQPQFRGQFNERQQNYAQSPSQSFAFPPVNGVQQPPPAFRHNIRPQQVKNPFRPFTRFHFLNKFIPFFLQSPVAPPLNLRQTQFQRSVQNQLGQIPINQPQHFNQFQPQSLNNPFVVQEPSFNNLNRPATAPLIQQQPPIRPQQNFLPNGQIHFPSQSPFIAQQNFQQNQYVAPQTNFQLQPQVNFPPPQVNFQPREQPQSAFLQSHQALPTEQRANVFHDARTEEQRQQEIELRQKLIEKQEKFAQKYYQKQQQQVQKLHEDFVKKQQLLQEETQEKLRPQQSKLVQQHHRFKHQNVRPTDFKAFEKSVQTYYQQNPTTTTTTEATKTTTPVPTTTTRLLTVVPLKKNKSKSEVKTLNGEDIQQLLQGNRQSLFSQLNLESKKPSKVTKSPLNREDLLKQLQELALDGSASEGTQDIVLPNGEQVQVIRTSDPELIRKAKSGNAIIKPNVQATTLPPLSIEELAKSGILPPGADFEVIRQSEDGLQQVQKVPQQKKVTFVYLEELDDGSFKVQGVKGNNDKEAKRSGAEVDSILSRIKTGEITLPPGAKIQDEKPILIPTPKPSTTLRTTTTQRTTPRTTQRQSSVSVIPLSSSSTSIPKNHRASSNENTLIRDSSIAPQTVTPERSSPRFRFSFSATTAPPEDEENSGRSPYSTLPTFATSERNNVYSVSPRVQRLSSTEIPEYDTAKSVNYIQNIETKSYVSSTRGQAASATTSSPTYASSIFSSPSYSPTFTTTPPTTFSTVSSKAAELTSILRDRGLFAMAKYLRQSGLDSILNETGPYTIFAPTDKAFKSLLVQLGGPEKAEEKFKNNPRLLSGLLLHHVIPGSFKIDELQDEMTGVSLAGTQLRVNQYQMQDTEWNDIKVTTINGATVASDNLDIEIPQGVAHSVDRVMFPLPVGDLLQTMQSDREKRFTHFLRAIFASNIADILQNKGESQIYKTLKRLANFEPHFRN